VPARPTTVLSGAIVGAHLAAIRDARSADPAVRRSARVLGTLAVAEALRDLETVDGEVTTPVAPARVTRPARRLTLVPVLRAGLVLLEPALDLLPPGTRVGFMGLSRDEKTLQPHTYLKSLPDDLASDAVVLLEVMIATGGSSVAALRALRAAGAERLHLVGLIAAPEGLAAVAAADPEVPITVAAIDERLDERGYIVPGLGDAGDRLYSEPG
jgi:uracil phosphoribosyltransferase